MVSHCFLALRARCLTSVSMFLPALLHRTREGKVPGGVTCTTHPVDELPPTAALALFLAVSASSQDPAAGEPALLLIQHT